MVAVFTLMGVEGGAEENIYDCEIWFTGNHSLKRTTSYREGNNDFKSLATLSQTSEPHAVAWFIFQLCVEGEGLT